MKKKELKFGTKESIVDDLLILKDRTDSAISYMNYKGKTGSLEQHLHDLAELQFWSSSVIREYIDFLHKNYTP